MEASCRVEDSKTNELLEMEEQECAIQLEDLIDEVVNLAEVDRVRKSALDSGSELEEIIDEKFYEEISKGEELELHIELPERSAQGQDASNAKVDETDLSHDVSVDATNEITSDPMGEVKHQIITQEPAEDVATNELINSKLSFNFHDNSVEPEDGSSLEVPLEENQAENTVEAGQLNTEGGSNLSATDAELANLMSDKMEKLINRVLEERFSDIVERIVTQKINKIFASMI